MYGCLFPKDIIYKGQATRTPYSTEMDLECRDRRVHYVTSSKKRIHFQGFIQNFELGGGGEDGSRMIVASKSMLMHA